MFTVYFDESYGPADAYVVAGYVATNDQWSEFEREWRCLLEREGITTLHRTDLESFHGEFTEANGWDPERRAHVVMQAQGIIRRRVNIGVSSGIIKSHFDNIPDEAKEHTGRHYYTLCVQDCFRHITNWANQYSRAGPIDYVFEEGAEGRGEVEEVLGGIAAEEQKKAVLRLGHWKFANKKEETTNGVLSPAVIPLQSADFLAYETYKQMANRIVDGIKRPVRKSMWDLLKLSHTSNYFDQENLAELVAIISAERP